MERRTAEEELRTGEVGLHIEQVERHIAVGEHHTVEAEPHTEGVGHRNLEAVAAGELEQEPVNRIQANPPPVQTLAQVGEPVHERIHHLGERDG